MRAPGEAPSFRTQLHTPARGYPTRVKVPVSSLQPPLPMMYLA